MLELVSTNTIPLRVLRNHFRLPDTANVIRVIRAVAREKKLTCSQYKQERRVFTRRGVLPRVVHNFCIEILVAEQERYRNGNGHK